MADYSRPASGFAFSFKGADVTSPPDKLAEGKFAIAQNVRAYDDTTMRSRPGLAQIATSATGRPVQAVRAYAALNTDNKPRFLFKSDTSSTGSAIYLDTGTQVDTGYAPGLGASLIPYRPNQSPGSYIYAGDANQYRKISAPDSSNAVSVSNVGVIEPQIPVDAGVSGHNVQFVGAPAPSTYTNAGTAGSITSSSRISDTVEAVFPDPTGLGMKSLQVSGGGGSLAPGVYLSGSVTAYFWTAATGGIFTPVFPLDPSTATANGLGSSIMFNPPQFNGTPNPNVQPMEWAELNSSGAITGYQIPWSGANIDYNMVVLANLYVPVAGSYTLALDHDDGAIFAISGASLVVGPIADPISHTKTAVAGYSFAGGGIGGTNHHGGGTDIFSINFPTAGLYPIEIDYNQNTQAQSLNLWYGGTFPGPGTIITTADTTTGYQRWMALNINSNFMAVQDVFQPLASALSIESIYYYSGTTGRCVITPASLAPVPGTDEQSLYDQTLISGLRRGALVQVGAEVCYVLNTSTGPDGSICFETVTTANHTNTESLFGVLAIAVFDPNNLVAAGNTIGSDDITFLVNTGIGSVVSSVPINPFISSNSSFQPDDYIHLSVNLDQPLNLTEFKVMFDVGDGSFQRNFYYYSVRQNDLEAGIQNQLTQLGAAQLVAQRAAIDQVQATESGNQGITSSSDQTSTGESQWSEILFPISALTRVGNDQTRSLQNVNAVLILFNCTGAVNVAMNSLMVLGGFSVDVGDIGAPMQYIIRPRSSITGARGNPSPTMRYGVNPRRQQVTVIVPISYPADPQADQWDIFRLGGSITAYTLAGTVPIGSSTQFIDNFADSAIVSSEQADYENFQPWPTIDLPLNTVATTVNGSTAVVTITNTVANPSLQTNVLRYLPGNLIQVGQQVYTLWTRPTVISGNNYLFQFVENAGIGTNLDLSIYEPTLANQILPYLWGPTEDGGNIFGCGDPLRPGFVYFCKNFQPDSAPDNYNIELCPPSEPLLGGETLNGNSYVASTDRWWQLRPSFGQANHYTPVEAPVGRGLAAPFGHCTDGSKIYFVAKDGIYVTAGGPGQSLSDGDLYNLFPHEGVAGDNQVYNGVTTHAPDYGRAQGFRLAYCNNYLYFDYQDSSGGYHTLIYDLRHQAWSTDIYFQGAGVSTHYAIEQQEGSLNNTDQTYGLLVVGSAQGALYKELDNAIDDTLGFACIVATREWTAEDERAQKLFGDVFFDFLNPPASSPTNLSAQAMSLGNPFSTTAFTQSAQRQQLPVDLAGGMYSFALGLFIAWSVNAPMPPVTLYTWQPSYVSKPATTAQRFQDLDNAGYEGAKWIQGFILEANSFGATKQIGVRNGDNQVLQQVFPIVHAIQSEKAYSFTQPFVAHMMRLEPQDGVNWDFFNVKWIWEKCPETVTTWWTQPSALGWEAYGHVFSIDIAYSSQAPVNFTMFFDGNQQNYTLPNTGGVYQKYYLNLQANKGKLYSFRYQSTANSPDLQIWLRDTILKVGAWERSARYVAYMSAGGESGDTAKI